MMTNSKPLKPLLIRTIKSDGENDQLCHKVCLQICKNPDGVHKRRREDEEKHQLGGSIPFLTDTYKGIRDLHDTFSYRPPNKATEKDDAQTDHKQTDILNEVMNHTGGHPCNFYINLLCEFMVSYHGPCHFVC